MLILVFYFFPGYCTSCRHCGGTGQKTLKRRPASKEPPIPRRVFTKEHLLHLARAEKQCNEAAQDDKKFPGKNNDLPTAEALIRASAFMGASETQSALLEAIRKHVGKEEPPTNPEEWVDVPVKLKPQEPSHWKRSQRKQLRNSGQKYITTKGTIRPARTVQPYEHKCRYECHAFTEEEREEIFNVFWGLENFDLQNFYICEHVQIISPKKRKAKGIGTQKTATRICYLNGKRVCRLFFLKTLDIGQGRYHGALTKKQLFGMVPLDRRGGKHKKSDVLTGPANPDEASEDNAAFNDIDDVSQISDEDDNVDHPTVSEDSHQINTQKTIKLSDKQQLNATPAVQVKNEDSPIKSASKKDMVSTPAKRRKAKPKKLVSASKSESPIMDQSEILSREITETIEAGLCKTEKTPDAHETSNQYYTSISNKHKSEEGSAADKRSMPTSSGQTSSNAPPTGHTQTQETDPELKGGYPMETLPKGTMDDDAASHHDIRETYSRDKMPSLSEMLYARKHVDVTKVTTHQAEEIASRSKLPAFTQGRYYHEVSTKEHAASDVNPSGLHHAHQGAHGTKLPNLSEIVARQHDPSAAGPYQTYESGHDSKPTYKPDMFGKRTADMTQAGLQHAFGSMYGYRSQPLSDDVSKQHRPVDMTPTSLRQAYDSMTGHRMPNLSEMLARQQAEMNQARMQQIYDSLQGNAAPHQSESYSSGHKPDSGQYPFGL